MCETYSFFIINTQHFILFIMYKEKEQSYLSTYNCRYQYYPYQKYLNDVFLQFCHDVINFVIEIILTVSIQKKEGKCFPPILSIYTTCTIICFCVIFLFVWCKNSGELFQRKGPREEKRMAKNNIMYIIMYTIDAIHMLHFCQPTANLIRLCKFQCRCVFSSTGSPREIHLVATPYVTLSIIIQVKQTILKYEWRRWKIAILTNKQNCTQFNRKNLYASI